MVHATNGVYSPIETTERRGREGGGWWKEIVFRRISATRSKELSTAYTHTHSIWNEERERTSFPSSTIQPIQSSAKRIEWESPDEWIVLYSTTKYIFGIVWPRLVSYGVCVKVGRCNGIAFDVIVLRISLLQFCLVRVNYLKHMFILRGERFGSTEQSDFVVQLMWVKNIFNSRN